MIKRTFWGIVFIALGVLAMMQALGQLPFPLRFWPVVLTLLGLGILWSSLRIGKLYKGPNWFGTALGLWVGGIGLFDILYDASVTEITGGQIAGAGWPLILIALGVSIIFGRSKLLVFNGRGRKHGRHEGHVVGDMRYGNSGPWVLDKDLTLDHGAGDMKIDFSTADIAEGVHQIRLNQAVGEMQVRVPDNVNVTVDAQVNIGECSVLGEHRNGMGLHVQKTVVVSESNIELVIYANLRMGSMRIVHVPARPRILA